MHPYDKLLIFRHDLHSKNLKKLAELMGIDWEFITEVPDFAFHMIVSKDLYEQHASAINKRVSYLMIYDCDLVLSQSKVIATRNIEANSIRINDSSKSITGPISGFEISMKNNIRIFTDHLDFNPIFWADQDPFFITKDSLFLLSTGAVIDLDLQVVEPIEPVKKYFIELVPFVIFIKYAFKKRCWHLKEKTACLIVDDPLLKKRYGCISYDIFLAWLKENNFAASFAFIPWNFKRSNKEIAELFRNNAEYLSICVHGCNHTLGEYGITR